MIGRPTDYKDEYVDAVLEYVKTCSKEQMRLPKRVDIALLLNCDEDTLNNWAKVHPEFFGALTRVDMMQKGQLMDDGMYGGKEVNPQIAKFLLSANHGMAETTKEEHTGKDGGAIRFENLEDGQLDQLIQSKIKQVGISGTVDGERKTNEEQSA